MIKKQLRRILPRWVIDYIQRTLNGFDTRLAVFASQWHWTSVLYYALCSGDFYREMHSVLKARRRYHLAQAGREPTSYLLRRNIHRLEKGLIMQPRRPVFGEAYIVETVEYFKICVRADVLLEEEYRWASDVLSEYFLVVCSSLVTEQARMAFTNGDLQLLAESELGGFKPMTISSLGPNSVTYEDLEALCVRRHSVRWFEDRPVPSELLDAAVAVASTAPSACNRQAFKFYVFETPETARKIGAIPMGTAGFSENFQSLVVVVGDLSAYPFAKDRHIIYIDSALAAMQFQLALETLGLSSCTINWPDIERHEREMAEALQLSDYQRPTLLIAVGYAKADSLVPYSAKRTVADIVVRPK